MGPVYVITDPMAPCPVVEQALLAARGGAGAVQIRDKTLHDDDFVALVAKLLPEMTARGVALIVNDRVEVALRSGAHGLHIGQGDGDPTEIRARLPKGMILGLSIETLEQAQRVPEGLDYIGAGPVRATATKPDHATPIGFDGLTQIAAAVRVPCYAIGGIKLGDGAVLRRAGAAGMAVVSAVARAPDPAIATSNLLREWNTA